MDQVIAAVRGELGRRMSAAWTPGSAAERGRFALWLPVFMGAGVVAYFGLRPSRPGGPARRGRRAGRVAAWLRRRRRCAALLLPLAAAALGFASAQFATARALPLEPLPRKAVVITGTVRAVELLPDGRRITIEAPRARATRRRSRAGCASGCATTMPAEIETGDTVRVRALIRPPSPPAYPGGWDLQRDAFFAGLGGSGSRSATPSAWQQAPPAGRCGAGCSGCARRSRRASSRRCPVPPGAVAATLLTGITSGIPEADRAAFRDSGLAHLLAVAGLHIGIVMGLALGADPPALALVGARRAALAVQGRSRRWRRWPPAGVYMLLTGMHVPIMRSFAMACLVTLGVRRRPARRLAARAGAGGRRADAGLAAGGGRRQLPDELFRRAGADRRLRGAAALAAPAARHRRWRRRFAAPSRGAGADQRCWPARRRRRYGAYHFGHVQLYFVLANMVAVPLTAMWVMPAGLHRAGADAVRAGMAGAGADGLGRRGDPVDRARDGGVAAATLARAAHAGLGPGGARARHRVARAVAQPASASQASCRSSPGCFAGYSCNRPTSWCPPMRG